MYIPPKFKQTNLDALYSFIQTYSLGTLIISDSHGIDANHIPFYLKHLENGDVRLQSHIAKANPLWKTCTEGQSILLIFHGPNAYVSPNLYPSKAQTGKAVPTWNYSVVHVKGRISFKHEASWLLPLLQNISDLHELQQDNPWSVSDAPEGYINKLTNAVVGVEIEIDEIVGNFKLSQNKTGDDYTGVLKGLAQSNVGASKQVAVQMKEL